MAKQYGLLLSEKNKVIRPSIFNEDSDSDTDAAKPTGISSLKKQERLAQEKAMAEDPTVYQYDELYDDMQSKRKESKLARKDLDKKPKYINKLLESAERRKRENERRIEKQVQKEREEEGDTFKDKESFVTTAYRKKLEEMKELEEKEKREAYLESIGDVRKQSDLSGFYRHLYAQQVNCEENIKVEKETVDESVAIKTEKLDKDPESEKKLNVTEEETKDDTSKTKVAKKRKYRKRDASKSSESEGEREIKLEHLPSNIDADSDFSIDSSSDSEGETKKTKTTVSNNEKEQETETKTEQTPDEVIPETNNEKKDTINEEVKLEVEKVEIPKKPKIDIWKKRTVGEVFDEALKKYYERKAARIDVF